MDLTHRFFATGALLFVVAGIACSTGDAPKNTNAPVTSSASPANTTSDIKPVATPRTDFTAADIEKLKWIEGTWRGMDGDKPFYERYKLEGTTLVVESLKEDGSPDGPPGRFELKNGEFGKSEGNQRSAASEITDKYIQFVPAGPVQAGGPRRNSFRFENDGGSWTAVLEWPASADKPAGQKIYTMEPWQPKK